MDRAQQFRQILSTRGLSLHRVSQKSAELFGHSSEFYVPHNLYSALAPTARTPTICQILALSQITNYRFADWLAVFGFELDAIFRLRLLVSRRRTALLDSTVHDAYRWIPWFTERPLSGPVPPIAPLGQLLAVAPARRAMELVALNGRKFLYAVIGERDLYALPHFVPGSVIRADPRLSGGPTAGGPAVRRETFFLLEHSSGWMCSRLVALGKGRVLAYCPQRPCLDRELEIGRDARILGTVDAEIRPLARHVPSIRKSKPSPLSETRAEGLLRKETGLKQLLRQFRLRAGFSFREGSALSRSIAETLSDERYFAAASTLSDYETLSVAPRQIQKIITLCILYGVGFEQFLRACGLPLEQAGREPIPDDLLARPGGGQRAEGKVATAAESTPRQAGFFAAMLDQWQELPLFLRFSLDEISGLRNLSLFDLFWVGGDRSPRHPLLADATLVAVNRRARKLAPHPASNVCDQPLCLILRRDGGYLCGRCVLDGGSLVVHGYPRGGVAAERFRNGIDAELAGQVTAILRFFPG